MYKDCSKRYRGLQRHQSYLASYLEFEDVCNDKIAQLEPFVKGKLESFDRGSAQYTTTTLYPATSLLYCDPSCCPLATLAITHICNPFLRRAYRTLKNETLAS